MSNQRTANSTLDPEAAWQPFDLKLDGAWDPGRVAHLHRRAGFGATPVQLARDLAEGFEASVQRVLHGEDRMADGQPAAEHRAVVAAMEESARRRPSMERVQIAFIYRMVYSPWPLVERMTLAWHGHYATGAEKVANPVFMLDQNLAQRELALGGVRALHARMLKDAALLIWLDATENAKGEINENLGREFLELFALGEGCYSERDVVGAAHALTGFRRFRVNQDAVTFLPEHHDASEKTLLGERGKWAADDVARIVAKHPAAARHVARLLYRTFISDTDEPGKVPLESLAKSMRRNGDVDIGHGVETVLRSKLFHTTAVRGRKVKSPTDFIVGAIRATQAFDPPPDLADIEWRMTVMGQRLFHPPSVAGWKGGLAWLSSEGLLARARFTDDFAKAHKANTRAASASVNGSNESLATLLLPGTPSPAVLAKVRNVERSAAIREILTMPEAQLM